MATNKVWHGLSPIIDLGILLYNIMLYSWQPTNIFTVNTNLLHSFTMMFEWEQPLLYNYSGIFMDLRFLFKAFGSFLAIASGASSSIIGQTLRHHQHRRYGRNVQAGRHSLGREDFRVMSYGWQFCVLFKTWRTFKGKQPFWPYPKGVMVNFFGSPSKFKQPKNPWFRNKSHQSRD